MDRRTEARRLQAVLSAETGIAVELRWDDSGAGKRSWHVVWSDGPTKDAMRAHVDRLTQSFIALKPADLVYMRTIQPISTALVMVRNVRLGQPPLGDMGSVWNLEYHLRDTSYPERGNEADLLRANELVQQSNALTDRMQDIMTRQQLVLVPAEEYTDNVLPFRRPTGPRA